MISFVRRLCAEGRPASAFCVSCYLDFFLADAVGGLAVEKKS